ncbi:type II toxin-antitoxin system HicB family antitoxin [Streptomyces alkaliphilus]|uniref:type II toxin-antitoxin system HicB family antitoxin n=1 Tax=Streptomyces alkaliphilus TaxID=1472722 RepID=UPI001889B0EC|nr:type II toxin-antitoxin system HicB family antitoxin [Streptomyces alkaliphilus]
MTRTAQKTRAAVRTTANAEAETGGKVPSETGTRYKATATRDGNYWVVEVHGLPPNHVGVTQGRTWAEAEEMAADVISMLLDIPETSFTVDLVPADEVAATALSELEAARAAALAAEKAEAAALRRAAEELTSRGFSVRDAGKALGISYQRVSQLAPRNKAA